MPQILLIIALLTAIGLPWATPRRDGRQSSWLEIGVESFASGICGVVVSGIVLGRLGLFDHVVPVSIALGSVGYVVRLLDGRGWGWPARPSMPAVVATGAIGGLALYLRRSPSDFLFHTGDMGEYVNMANLTSRTGSIDESFLHGFIAVLGWTRQLLGFEWTEMAVPALGVGIVAAIVAVLQRLAVPTWVQCTVGFLAAIQLQLLWFSLIPVSETLLAFLVAITLHQLVRSGQEPPTLPAGLLVGSILGLAIMVTKANGMLLVPALVVGTFLGALASRSERRIGPLVLAVGLTTGVALGYLYDVHSNVRYFVDLQLRVTLPSRVLEEMTAWGLTEVTLELLAVLALGCGVTAGLAFLVATRAPQAPRTAVAVPTIALVVVLIGAAVLPESTLWVNFGRWNLAVLGASIIGLAALAWSAIRRGDDGALLAPVVLVVVVAFVALQAKRLSEAPPDPAYLLYWDRYLYSELLVVALILAGVGLTTIAAGGERLLARRPHARSMSAIATGVLVAVLVVPTAHLVSELQSDRLFGDTDMVLDGIDAASGGDAEDSSRLLLSVEGSHPRWNFGRFHRSFALPLIQSFGRRFDNVDVNPAAPDPVVQVESGILVDGAGEPIDTQAQHLVDIHVCGDVPCPADLEPRLDLPVVETIEYRVPTFWQSDEWLDDEFADVWLRIVVYDISGLGTDDN